MTEFLWWWTRVLAGATAMVCAVSTTATVTKTAPELGWVGLPLAVFVLLPLWGAK